MLYFTTEEAFRERTTPTASASSLEAVYIVNLRPFYDLFFLPHQLSPLPRISKSLDPRESRFETRL